MAINSNNPNRTTVDSSVVADPAAQQYEAHRAPLPEGQPAPQGPNSFDQTTTQSYPGAVHQPGSGRGNTTGELSAYLARTLPRHGSSERVTKIMEIMGELLKGIADGNTFELRAFDGAKWGADLSAIVLVMRDNADANSMRIGTHVMLLEGTGQKLLNPVRNIAGYNPITIQSVASDVYNKRYSNAVSTMLGASYGQNVKIVDTGCTVIPEEVVNDDINILRKMLSDGIEACEGAIRGLQTRERAPLTVKAIRQNNRVEAHFDFKPEPEYTSSGLPIRSDMNLIMTARADNGGNAQDHNQGDNIVLSSLSGYVNLIPCAPQQQPINPYMPQAPQPSYIPQLIITNLDTSLTVSFETQLLALASAAMFNKEMLWSQVFERRMVRGVNTRDIGAIGLELPHLTQSDPAQQVPRRIDTQSDQFDNMALIRLLSQAVTPNLVYSMDVAEAGQNTWLQWAFVAAAGNDEYADYSRSAIITAADYLTEGKFSEVFGNNRDICIDEGTRLHTGYYVDQNRQTRNIDDIDYLAVLNLQGEHDMGVVAEWEKTFNPAIPTDIRLEQRDRLLKALLGESVQFKGAARRITFYPAFIEALATAVDKAGLQVQPSNLRIENNSQLRRPMSQLQAFTVNSQKLPAFYAGAQNVNTQPSTGLNNRWGIR